MKNHQMFVAALLLSATMITTSCRKEEIIPASHSNPFQVDDPIPVDNGVAEADEQGSLDVDFFQVQSSFELEVVNGYIPFQQSAAGLHEIE